jgi:GDP-L-fucose synthase
MQNDSRIYVAGGDTLLGRSLIDHLQSKGFSNLVGVPPQEPDLTHAGQVEDFFGECRPEYVFLTGGKSGGIAANLQFPADLMIDNLLVSVHVLQAALHHRVKKLLYLGSSCMYPRDAVQPLRPQILGTGPMEPTNEAYALAKWAGLKLCLAMRQQHGANFVCAIPANVFGPNDDFSPNTAHVIPALITRMHQAKEGGRDRLEIWGTGNPRRDFLFSRDFADACLFVMDHFTDATAINLGSGRDWSIGELAKMIAEVVGFEGELVFDSNKPDGMPRKCLDARVLQDMGWRKITPLREALEETYSWFLAEAQRRGLEPVEL